MVSHAGPGPDRGLWHDRELRRLALHPARLRGVGTVGQPYEWVESRIDPDNGEIQMRCGALMQGYYREDAATAAGHHARRLAAHRRQGPSTRRQLSITGR